MKTVKIILVSIGVLLVVTFAGVLYLATYLDEHKDLLQGGLSKALGREVRIEGGVKVAWSMTPSVALEGLWVGNADWASAPHLARARQAIVSFRLIPLLSRRLELSEFRLLNADVFVEKAADGRYNWEAASTGKGDTGVAVAIDALQVEDSSLHYRAAAGSDLVLNVPRLEFGNPGDGEIVFQGNLSYRDVPLSLAGKARNKANVGSSARTFAIQVEIPDATLNISGDVTGIRDFSHLEMDLNSDSVDLRKWLSKIWPAVAFDGTLKALKARLKTSGDTLESLTANTSGALTVATAVLKPPTGKEAKDASVVLNGLRIGIEPGQAVELQSALAYAEQSYQIGLHAGTFEDLFYDRKTWRKIKVDLRGQSKRGAVAITGEVGPWSTQGAAAGLGVDLSLQDKALKVGVEGSLARFGGLQGSRFAVTASAPSLALLNPWLGITMPDTAPFAFSANVEGGAQQFSLRDLKLTSGGSDVSGKLTVPLVNGGRFEAVIESRVLDLRPYVAASSQQAGKTVPLLERELLPDALQGLDGSLRYRVKKLKTGALETKTVSFDVTLDKGHLKFTLAADNENLNADVKLRPAGEHWHLALRHKGKLILGNLIALDKEVPDRSLPPVETELTLGTTGRSLGAMLDAANGQFLMVLGPGTLSEKLTPNLPLGDVLLTLLNAINPGGQTGRGVKMECAVMQMDIAKGVATSSKGLAVRTENFNVLGGGALKLRTGEIDLRFKTAQRKGLGISLLGIADRFIRITGRLHRPEVAVNAGSAVVYGAAAWASGGLSILYDSVFKRLTAFSNPCDTVLEAIGQKP